jgi:dTDP-4-dehydrorhamnose reductase
MSQKKILIIGGSGFVGSHLARTLSGSHSVTATWRNEATPIPGVEFIRFNALHDKDKCMALVQKIEPQVVIYAAGSNDLKKAESEPNPTQIAHISGPNHMLIASEYVKAKYLYFSNDSVFSGDEGNFSEADTAIPGFALGKAKLGAENYIRSRSLNHVIFRCAPLLGRGPLDHPSWLDHLREESLHGKFKPLSRKTLQNPVHIRELVTAIERVMDQDIRNKTLHIGGLTKVSPYDLAVRFLKTFGLAGGGLPSATPDSEAPIQDHTLNFTQSLKLLQTEPLFLEQSLDLLK